VPEVRDVRELCTLISLLIYICKLLWVAPLRERQNKIMLNLHWSYATLRLAPKSGPQSSSQADHPCTHNHLVAGILAQHFTAASTLPAMKITVIILPMVTGIVNKLKFCSLSGIQYSPVDRSFQISGLSICTSNKQDTYIPHAGNLRRTSPY